MDKLEQMTETLTSQSEQRFKDLIAAYKTNVPLKIQEIDTRTTRLYLRTAMRCTCRPCIAHWKGRSAIPESSLYVTSMDTAAYSMRADNDSVMANEEINLFARILNTRIDWTTLYYTITAIPSTHNVRHGFAAPRALSSLLHPLTSLGFTTGEFIGNRNLSICFHYS